MYVVPMNDVYLICKTISQDKLGIVVLTEFGTKPVKIKLVAPNCNIVALNHYYEVEAHVENSYKNGLEIVVDDIHLIEE